MRRDDRDDYQAWLWGEVLLIWLMGAALGLFLAYPSLRTSYELPELRLVLDTAVTLAATVVAVLAGIRFSVEGRGVDLALCTGFAAAATSTVAFSVVPALDGEAVGAGGAWAGIGGNFLAVALIAAAPYLRGRLLVRTRTVGFSLAALAVVLAVLCGALLGVGEALPSPAGDGVAPPLVLTVLLGVQAVLSLVALVGFGLRFRSEGQDLDRWFALGATLMLFAEIHYVFTPVMSSALVTQGDFLRLLSFGVLLAGVWRAIRFAEFGRAVAEERARVAREIHDGLAQYLFTISTHASLLEAGTAREDTVARLKEAAALAQQEARFAVLALSSASGNAPFDAALRRYVDMLAADGGLDVELEVDAAVSLAPDEQIEVFRIVQEGLANVRKHAGAGRVVVRIGREGTRRFVLVEDDGAGFEGEHEGAGQGVRNMERRAASIGGGFDLRSRPGTGTALEVTLRA